MESKYYSFTLIILAYTALGLLAEILIHLQIAAMRFKLSSLIEINPYILIAPFMVLIGYATVKSLISAE